MIKKRGLPSGLWRSCDDGSGVGNVSRCSLGVWSDSAGRSPPISSGTSVSLSYTAWLSLSLVGDDDGTGENGRVVCLFWLRNDRRRGADFALPAITGF